MSSFQEAPFGSQPPPRKSSKMWIFLLIGGLLLIPLTCCGGALGFFWLGTSVLSTEAKQDVAGTPEAVAELGEVQSASTNLMASGEEKNRAGREVVVFDIKGTKGTGQLIVEQPGTPTRKSVLRLPNGKEIPVKQ